MVYYDSKTNELIILRKEQKNTKEAVKKILHDKRTEIIPE